MKLIDYIHQLPGDQREPFAQACETSVGHLRNVAYGYRPCSPELAALIECNSLKAVTRQELCPDNWRRVWPELVSADEKQHPGFDVPAQAAIKNEEQEATHA